MSHKEDAIQRCKSIIYLSRRLILMLERTLAPVSLAMELEDEASELIVEVSDYLFEGGAQPPEIRNDEIKFSCSCGVDVFIVDPWTCPGCGRKYPRSIHSASESPQINEGSD